MDQDATWYGARPRPKRLCVRWGPSSPSSKRRRSPLIFGPCLLWPNGWMDQDGTWHGGGPRSRPHCARWGSNYPPQKGPQPPIFGRCLLWPNGCMYQDTNIGTEVGLSLGDIVLDGDPYSPSAKGAQPAIFGQSIVAKRLDGLRCHLVWR